MGVNRYGRHYKWWTSHYIHWTSINDNKGRSADSYNRNDLLMNKIKYHFSRDKDWLYENYITKNLSIQKIADAEQMPFHVIRNALLKAEIPMKPQKIYGHVNHPNRTKENHPGWKGGKPKCKGCEKQLQNYWNERCNACYREFNRKENHPSFNKEKNKTWYRLARNSEEYIVWRKEIYAKFNYKCFICDEKKSQMDAHHLDNFAQFPEKRYEVNNGVLLCKEHHNDFHKKFKARNNVRQQFYNYYFTTLENLNGSQNFLY